MSTETKKKQLSPMAKTTQPHAAPANDTPRMALANRGSDTQ